MRHSSRSQHDLEGALLLLLGDRGGVLAVPGRVAGVAAMRMRTAVAAIER
jgi:hypothetical protein